jgi:hypothetical protein
MVADVGGELLHGSVALFGLLAERLHNNGVKIAFESTARQRFT